MTKGDSSEIHEQVYDTLASEYEDRSSLFIESINSTLDFANPFLKGNNVLEIGCGVGLIIENLIKRGYKVTSVEISQQMAEYAQKRNPTARIIVGDFLKVSLNEKFDSVILSAFIHLFQEKEALSILKKVRNLLSENGTVFINTTESTIDEEGWFEKEDYKNKVKRYRKFWRKESFEKLLSDAGFKIIAYKRTIDPTNRVWINYVIL